MSVELQAIQRCVLDAMFDKDLLDDALELISAYAGTQAVQMISGGDESYILESHLYGVDQVFREKEQSYWSINPRFIAIPKMGEMRAVRDHDFISQEDMDKSPAYQELLYPADVGYFAGLMLRNSPTSIVGIALGQSREAGPISDIQARKLEVVGSAVKPLLELASKLSLVQADTALAASGTQPAAVVRRDRVVMRANAAFDELLSAGVMWLDGQQRLDFRSKQANRDFRGVVAASVITSDSRFILHNASGVGPFLCTLYPLPVEDLMLKRGEVMLLQLERPLQPLMLDEAIVASVFGLTPAETGVASMLFRGLDLNTIARDRGTSISTVRTIIKAVLNKTECHRQAELVSKLAPFGRREERPSPLINI